MPTFRITAPDGATYEVSGENEDGALAALQSHLGAAPMSAGEKSADVAKSAGIGLVKGGLGLAGLAGDSLNLIRGAGDAIAQAPGRLYNRLAGNGTWDMPEASQRAAQAVDANLPKVGPADVVPGAADLQKRVESVTGEFYAPKTIAGKYAQTAAEFIPGAMLAPGSKAVNALKYGVVPAVASEAAGQATEGTKFEPYARIGAALAGSQVIDAAKRIATPFPVSGERQRLLNVLTNEGVETTAGQKVGSKGLRYLESAADQAPLGGGRAAEIAESQGEQFTKAALKRAGINAERATPDVMEQAFTRIGGEFDRLSANNVAKLDNGFVGDVTGVLGEYNSLVPETARKPVIREIANDILKRAVSSGQIEGEAYQSMRSRLDRYARASGNDPDARQAFYGLRNALDDLMERNLSGPDKSAWQQARKEYRNILPLEAAAAGAGEKAAEGLISPSALRNAVVQKQGTRNYVKGEGDFADLARAGEAVLKPLPDSGTAGRSQAMRYLGGNSPIVGALVGGGLGHAVGGPIGSSAGMLAGATLGKAAEVGVPAALARALMSKPVQNYLANQKFAGPALNRNERLIQALMSAQAGRLGN